MSGRPPLPPLAPRPNSFEANNWPPSFENQSPPSSQRTQSSSQLSTTSKSTALALSQSFDHVKSRYQTLVQQDQQRSRENESLVNRIKFEEASLSSLRNDLAEIETLSNSFVKCSTQTGSSSTKLREELNEVKRIVADTRSSLETSVSHYQEASRVLQNVEADLFQRNQAVNVLADRLRRIQDKEKALQRRIEATHKHSADQRQTKTTLLRRIDDTKSKELQLANDITHTETKLKEMVGKLELTSEEIEKLKEEIMVMEKAISAGKHREQTLIDEIGTMRTDIHTVSSQLEELNACHGAKAELDRAIADTEAEISKVGAETESHKARLQLLVAETDGKKAALEQLRSQVAAAKKQLKSEKAELKHLRKLDDVQAECTQAKASISKVEDNLQSRVASTTEATRRIAELESQTTGWKSEIKALSKEVTQLKNAIRKAPNGGAKVKQASVGIFSSLEERHKTALTQQAGAETRLAALQASIKHLDDVLGASASPDQEGDIEHKDLVAQINAREGDLQEVRQQLVLAKAEAESLERKEAEFAQRQEQVTKEREALEDQRKKHLEAVKDTKASLVDLKQKLKDQLAKVRQAEEAASAQAKAKLEKAKEEQEERERAEREKEERIKKSRLEAKATAEAELLKKAEEEKAVLVKKLKVADEGGIFIKPTPLKRGRKKKSPKVGEGSDEENIQDEKVGVIARPPSLSTSSVSTPAISSAKSAHNTVRRISKVGRKPGPKREVVATHSTAATQASSSAKGTINIPSSQGFAAPTIASQAKVTYTSTHQKKSSIYSRFTTPSSSASRPKVLKNSSLPEVNELSPITSSGSEASSPYLNPLTSPEPAKTVVATTVKSPIYEGLLREIQTHKPSTLRTAPLASRSPPPSPPSPPAHRERDIFAFDEATDSGSELGMAWMRAFSQSQGTARSPVRATGYAQHHSVAQSRPALPTIHKPQVVSPAITAPTTAFAISTASHSTKRGPTKSTNTTASALATPATSRNQPLAAPVITSQVQAKRFAPPPPAPVFTATPAPARTVSNHSPEIANGMLSIRRKLLIKTPQAEVASTSKSIPTQPSSTAKDVFDFFTS